MNSHSIGGMNPGPMRGVSGTERKSSNTVKPSDTGLSQVNSNQEKAAITTGVEKQLDSNVENYQNKIDIAKESIKTLAEEIKSLDRVSQKIEIQKRTREISSLKTKIDRWEGFKSKTKVLKQNLKAIPKAKTTDNDEKQEKLQNIQDKIKKAFNEGQVKITSHSRLSSALKGKEVSKVKFQSSEKITQSKNWGLIKQTGYLAQITCSDGTVLKALVHKNDEGIFEFHRYVEK